MELIGLRGEIVRNWSELEKGEMEVDLSDMAPGIYFIRLRYDDGYQTRKVLIK